MGNYGNKLRDAVLSAIWQWQLPGVRVHVEPWVGSRYVDRKRRVDIVLWREHKALGIECKLQETEGTAYQKLPYALDDARITPIPTIIVFAGQAIQPDVKAQLIASGLGIEVKWDPEAKAITGGLDVLRQRVMMELGLDWLAEQPETLFAPHQPGAPGL